jgi:hypothetical protein
MKEEVTAIYKALIKPTTIYCNAQAEYEVLRKQLIEKHGYDGFWDIQHKAFVLIGSGSAP